MLELITYRYKMCFRVVLSFVYFNYIIPLFFCDTLVFCSRSWSGSTCQSRPMSQTCSVRTYRFPTLTERTNQGLLMEAVEPVLELGLLGAMASS